MAPPRRHISSLGEALRAARKAAGIDQAAFGKLVYLSTRQLSRLENGGSVTDAKAQDILKAFAGSSDEVRIPLYRALGVPFPEPPAAPPPPPPAKAPPPAPVVDRRALLDAVILAFAEERDVLPRHLRAFAVQLFRSGARLGVGMEEAARLVAAAERDPVVGEPRSGTSE